MEDARAEKEDTEVPYDDRLLAEVDDPERESSGRASSADGRLDFLLRAAAATIGVLCRMALSSSLSRGASEAFCTTSTSREIPASPVASD